jgi:two-component system, chemotaxis family, chemotaxis protein CheY
MALNILVVDDSMVMRSIIKKSIGMTMLDIEKFHEGSDGGKALDVISNNDNIDIIITDINMPNVSGLEFLKNLDPSIRSSRPIFVISSNDNPDIMDACDELDIDAFIKKPFNPSDIEPLFIEKLKKYGKY